MSPATKSIICAILLGAAAGWAVAHWDTTTAGSFASGGFFVLGLIVFGRLFGVPSRT